MPVKLPAFDFADDMDLEEELAVDKEQFPHERFKPIRLLGKGAVGEVYLCLDKILRKKVAVKILFGVTGDRARSFQDEAKILSRLHHETIIKILDFGCTDSGRPYMVLEHFPGISLECMLSESGPLNEAVMVQVFLKVCHALDYMHERGVLHRDLKPSNILVSVDKRGAMMVKVIDFGLAKFTEESLSKTVIQGRTIAGTPTYMCPDQVAGLSYTASSDIYSLGCIMFEALCGTPPFVGQTAIETISLHVNAPVPAPSDLAPDITPGVSEIILKCLSKRSDDRYSSMRELATALSQMSNEISPLTGGTQSSSQSSRKDIVILASLLLLVLAGGAFAFYHAWEFTHSKIDLKPKVVQEDTASRSKMELDFIGEPDTAIVAGEPFSSSDIRANLLYLNGRSPTDSLRDAIKKKRKIKMVVVNYGSLSDSDAKLIGKLHPSTVNLEGSIGVTDNTIQVLSQTRSIQGLHLDFCKALTPKGLSYLSRLPALTYISLRECDLKDEHVKSLAGVMNLRLISLEGNRRLTLNSLSYLCRKPRYVWVVADKGALGVVPFNRRKEIYNDMKIQLEASSPDVAQQMAKIMVGEEGSSTQFLSPESRRKILQPGENAPTGE